MSGTDNIRNNNTSDTIATNPDREIENRAECDAWNPGITSQIPGALKPGITLYRAENSEVDYQRARELSDFCGLKPEELISFRVERLVTHELLIRVTSDLSVPDGPNYEDLGINLRTMVSNIYFNYALPEIPQMAEAFANAKSDALNYIEAQIDSRLFASRADPDAASVKPSFFKRLFSADKKKPTASSLSEPAEFAALNHWRSQLSTETDESIKACLAALIKVVDALVGHRGRVINQPDLISAIANNIASNRIGSDLVSVLVDPVFRKAIEKENYRLLPVQEKPVVMNVKGASASGKSTIRPQQRQLADKLNIPWEDFALISPDYWRKFLLDYSSLGDDYKYAAMLTGQELEVVDRKLDRYMADKAARGEITHLLIDRFRFDSFTVDSGEKNKESRLLSRFGDRVFMFFMITPPAETVVRAWQRGSTTGRFKAVDDLLYHNVEAYTGMPALFLSWVNSRDKQVHFEFLDNDVPKGEIPKTAAFGWNDTMTIVDIELMRKIDLYRKVNVDARDPEHVLMESQENSKPEFLMRCIETIEEVKFAEPASGRVYAQFKGGKIDWCDTQYITRRTDASELTALFNIAEQPSAAPATSMNVDHDERQYTLGRW